MYETRVFSTIANLSPSIRSDQLLLAGHSYSVSTEDELHRYAGKRIVRSFSEELEYRAVLAGIGSKK